MTLLCIAVTDLLHRQVVFANPNILQKRLQGDFFYNFLIELFFF